MKTIIANLKLYINLNSWFFFMMLITLIFFNIQVVSDQDSNEQLIVGSFMCLPFFLGFMASIVLIDVMNKPFSFCLPGHRQNVKKVLMIMAVLVGLFFAFLMCYLILDRMQLACFSSIFFATLVFFLIGAELNMFARIICALIYMMSFFFFTYHYPFVILGRFILEHFLIVICIGLGGSITVWRLLDSPGLARRFCDNPKWMSFLNFWSNEKMQKLNRYKETFQKEKSKLKINPSVERFFLNKMNSHKYFSAGRYIWGSLYQAFSLPFSNFHPVNLLILLLFIFAFCYWPRYFWMVFLMLPMGMAMSIENPVYSNMMISNGRRERYKCTLVTGMVNSGFLVAIMTIIILFSKFAGLFMPDLKLSGKTLVYHAISFQLILIPLVAVPIALIFRLLSRKNNMLAVFPMLCFYFFYIMSIGAQKIFDRNVNINEISLIMNLYSIAYLIIVWIIFVLVLRQICFKKSLV
ncbi:MAG: hypothetical protein JXA96_14630 [Sedimentisphaerales bacterium]|nr:hypothetical protein [Sedimentisphaerales bacterium]